MARKKEEAIVNTQPLFRPLVMPLLYLAYLDQLLCPKKKLIIICSAVFFFDELTHAILWIGF
jgi:hypothetical protein